MNSIGIMQGRLTPSNNKGIQFFPFDNWKNEFYLAEDLELNEIEFIFDFDKFSYNPLYTINGLKEIKTIIDKTGVNVNSICLDYFMQRAFYKYDNNLRKENKNILKKMIEHSEYIGYTLIEIPLVDNSSLIKQQDFIDFKEFILEILYESKSNIKIGLETNLKPEIFMDYIQSFKSNSIVANYDSGNSAEMKYNPYDEILTLKNLLQNVHIKDKNSKNLSVNLGSGIVDFNTIFKLLKDINYKKSFILQAARDTDNNEINTIKKQIEFIRSFI